MIGLVSVAVCGAVCGAGILGLAVSPRAGSDQSAEGQDARPDLLTRGARWVRSEFVPLVSVIFAAGLFGFLTGWVVAVPIAGVAAFALPRLLRRTSGKVAIEKVEAVAAWTEMLQGTLAAAAGLQQAIVVTAPLSPLALRRAAGRLAAQLGAGVQPRDALLEFADEVADPSADRVVCALLLAVTSRAQQLGELLAALAEATREEVALRLRVETSRASVRSGVRTVVIFSVLFAAGLAVLARSYLAPFGTPTGQLVLVLVALLYGTGLTFMVWLARPPQPVRLLGREVLAR